MIEVTNGFYVHSPLPSPPQFPWVSFSSICTSRWQFQNDSWFLVCSSVSSPRDAYSFASTQGSLEVSSRWAFRKKSKSGMDVGDEEEEDSKNDAGILACGWWNHSQIERILKGRPRQAWHWWVWFWPCWVWGAFGRSKKKYDIRVWICQLWFLEKLQSEREICKSPANRW